jgi:hypothetical protein
VLVVIASIVLGVLLGMLIVSPQFVPVPARARTLEFGEA